MQDLAPISASPTSTPSPASTSTPEAETGAKTTATTGALTSDFETFLTLLTTQLRNQDPLKPLDSTEFVAQLASFSAVEQQINTNKKLDDLLGALTNSGIEEASRLIGRNVETSTSAIEINASHPVTFGYDIPAGADKAVLNIQSPAGKLVRTLPLSLLEGEITWDGLDTSGTPVAPGRYDIKIEAVKDLDPLDGGPVKISGQVDEAHIGNGDVMLVLANGLVIAPGDVEIIRAVDLDITDPDAANP